MARIRSGLYLLSHLSTLARKNSLGARISLETLSATIGIADSSLTMLPTPNAIAQQDEATSTLALLEQGVEATNDSAIREVADSHSVLTTDELGDPKKHRNSSLSEHQPSSSLMTALEETSKNLCEGSIMHPSESFKVASDSDNEESPNKESRRDRVKQQQGQHRAEHRERKLMLRRRRLMRETDETQDAEPEKVNPFNALPFFEYLELAADVEVELPSELVGFGSMDLSEADASPLRSLDDFNAENLGDSSAVSDDLEVVDAAARMLEQINALPLGGLDLGATPPTTGFDADVVSPEMRSELASALMLGASMEETLFDRSLTREVSPPGIASAYRFSTPVPIDSIVGPTSDSAASEFSRVHVQSSILPNAMRDNFLCHYATCPVTEMHCEGPYYYKGRLGDQNHNYFKGSNPPPCVWEAYDKVVRGISSGEEDEMVTGFWAWHVPPFCYIPDGPDDGFCSRPDEAGDATSGDQDMGDA